MTFFTSMSGSSAPDVQSKLGKAKNLAIGRAKTFARNSVRSRFTSFGRK